MNMRNVESAKEILYSIDKSTEAVAKVARQYEDKELKAEIAKELRDIADGIRKLETKHRATNFSELTGLIRRVLRMQDAPQAESFDLIEARYENISQEALRLHLSTLRRATMVVDVLIKREDRSTKNSILNVVDEISQRIRVRADTLHITRPENRK